MMYKGVTCSSQLACITQLNYTTNVATCMQLYTADVAHNEKYCANSKILLSEALAKVNSVLLRNYFLPFAKSAVYSLLLSSAELKVKFYHLRQLLINNIIVFSYIQVQCSDMHRVDRQQTNVKINFVNFCKNFQLFILISQCSISAADFISVCHLSIYICEPPIY